MPPIEVEPDPKVSPKRRKEFRKEMEKNRDTVHTNGQDLKNVPEFPYLGFMCEVDGSQKANLERRLAIAWQTFGELRDIWNRKAISINLKLRIYQSAVIMGSGRGWLVPRRIRCRGEFARETSTGSLFANKNFLT